ncbi:MAG: hypothetical protein LQ351_005030 [Letrouitia transgressa]|nr:MAG: hypothetical protein LQ351_005030 [Letrouitia transgressa]
MSSQVGYEEQHRSSSSNHTAVRSASHARSQKFSEFFSVLGLLSYIMGKFPGWLARLYPGIVVPEDFPLLEYPYNVLLPPHFTFTRVDEVHEPHDQMWHKVQEFKKEVDEKLDELYNFDNIIVLYSRLGEFHGSQRKRYGFDENDNLEDPRFFSVSGSESGIRAHWSQIFDVIKAVRCLIESKMKFFRRTQPVKRIVAGVNGYIVGDDIKEG